jgi:hypothetical protein
MNLKITLSTMATVAVTALVTLTPGDAIACGFSKISGLGTGETNGPIDLTGGDLDMNKLGIIGGGIAGIAALGGLGLFLKSRRDRQADPQLQADAAASVFETDEFPIVVPPEALADLTAETNEDSEDTVSV